MEGESIDGTGRNPMCMKVSLKKAEDMEGERFGGLMARSMLGNLDRAIKLDLELYIEQGILFNIKGIG